MMDALKKAIMQRRMKLAGMDEGESEDKNANLNPDEGSMDDLDIDKAKGLSDDGMAPDSDMGESDDEGQDPDNDLILPSAKGEATVLEEKGGDLSQVEKFYAHDDLGKPGIKGKAAAKMKAAMDLMRLRKD